jgi:hypothetical protein
VLRRGAALQVKPGKVARQVNTFYYFEKIVGRSGSDEPIK